MFLNNSIKVAIASDQQLIKYSFKSFLQNQKEILIITEPDSKENIISYSNKDEPDVCIISFSSIYKSLWVCNAIKKASLPIHPIIFSNINNNRFSYLSLYAGASGYLTFNTTPEEVLYAIKQVSEGKNYFVPQLNKKLSLELQHKYKLELESILRMVDARLSGREREILDLITIGFTSKEIASDLKICKKTVENIRTRMNNKLGLNSLSAVISFAIMTSIF